MKEAGNKTWPDECCNAAMTKQKEAEGTEMKFD